MRMWINLFPLILGTLYKGPIVQNTDCPDDNATTFSANVTQIGVIAFQDCTNLTGIINLSHTSLKFIRDSAFQNTNITSIAVPQTTLLIGPRAFQDCTNLTGIINLSHTSY